MRRVLGDEPGRAAMGCGRWREGPGAGGEGGEEVSGLHGGRDEQEEEAQLRIPDKDAHSWRPQRDKEAAGQGPEASLSGERDEWKVPQQTTKEAVRSRDPGLHQGAVMPFKACLVAMPALMVTALVCCLAVQHGSP